MGERPGQRWHQPALPTTLSRLALARSGTSQGAAPQPFPTQPLSLHVLLVTPDRWWNYLNARQRKILSTGKRMYYSFQVLKDFCSYVHTNSSNFRIYTLT